MALSVIAKDFDTHFPLTLPSFSFYFKHTAMENSPAAGKYRRGRRGREGGRGGGVGERGEGNAFFSKFN